MTAIHQVTMMPTHPLEPGGGRWGSELFLPEPPCNRRLNAVCTYRFSKGEPMLGEFKAGIGRLLLRSKVTGDLAVALGVDVAAAGIGGVPLARTWGQEDVQRKYKIP